MVVRPLMESIAFKLFERLYVAGVDALGLPARPAEHWLHNFDVHSGAVEAERLAALGTDGADLRLGPKQDSAIGAALPG
jgi:hypothetical protein